MWESTGKPVEGRLVGVIPTKTWGGTGERASRKKGLSQGIIMSPVELVYVSTRPWLVFASVFRVSTLGRKICEYVVAECGCPCQSGIIRVF